MVAHTRWRLFEAGLVREAGRVLCRQPGAVVLCEAKLPDGSWREMLGCAARLALPPPVIVAANESDRDLCMAVLSGGAYNLIGKPLEDHELYQLVSCAWLHRRNCALASAG